MVAVAILVMTAVPVFFAVVAVAILVMTAVPVFFAVVAVAVLVTVMMTVIMLSMVMAATGTFLVLMMMVMLVFIFLMQLLHHLPHHFIQSICTLYGLQHGLPLQLVQRGCYDCGLVIMLTDKRSTFI